uniref:Uncharacterized protein n=1 Tax=Arundo donax TaxID=35708 RepID=A0A0A9E213_ARUDO
MCTCNSFVYSDLCPQCQSISSIQLFICCSWCKDYR